MSEKIQRYYVDRENVTPSHYGMGIDSRGEYVLYSDARAWVIAELEALAKASCEYCRQGYSHFSNKHGCETIRRRIAELEKEGA